MENFVFAPGCDRCCRQNYPAPLALPLWDLLAGGDAFPGYRGERMTLIDAWHAELDEFMNRHKGGD